jgi:hypothetical protein
MVMRAAQVQGRKPAQRTATLPGTADKVKAMAERVARGEGCFHPDDAILTDDWGYVVVDTGNGRPVIVRVTQLRGVHG